MKKNANAESDITHVLNIDQSGNKRKRLKRWLVWGAAVIALAALLIFWMWGAKAETVQFKTQKAQRGDLTITVGATGNLEPTNQVDVGSELSGIVKSVEADYNDRVEVGQVLARLDTAKLEAEANKSKAALESAKAQVVQAQATVKETRAKMGRMNQARALSGGKVPSQQDLDTAEAAFERARANEAIAKAQVTEARATLDVNETNLAKAVIHSPIRGIVLSRNVEPGQTVAASLQAPVLFTLAEDLTQMELHVDIDEADVGEVTKEQEAAFTVDAYPDRTFPARIIQVRYGSQTAGGVVTYKAVLKVDNSELLLRPGMTAAADITVKKVENAILVPNSALRFTPTGETAGKDMETSGSGSIVNKLLPRPPRRQKTSSEQRPDNGGASRQRVWTANNGKLVPVPVATGATDGIRTEIKEGDVMPGMALVVGIVSAKK
ncbi:MAG: efflux RND transporter periplasmic adaptor subunit [Deltaproteobacteria bacterium]|nr:efflux RND transporter periplasmic adaptor subunit [Deltaproteobacteria bacterium]